MRSPENQPVNNVFQVVRRFRLMLLVFLASLPASVSGDGGLSPGPGTRGVQVTMEVPFASESLEAVRSRAPGRPARNHGDRAIPRHRIDRDPLADPSGLPAPPLSQAISFPAPAVAPRAPALDSSFPGLGNPPPGEDVIPPDTMGAAGPNHLVSLLNSEFGVFDKNGNRLDNVSLQSFWASLGTDPGEPAHFPFDTKVLWDPHSGRFAAVTLGGTSAGSSWIMIAVSASDNPLGAWHKWAIPSSPDNTVWADYPGFGLDGANLYVTANMFNTGGFYQYSKIWVIPKAQLVGGSTTITWTPFTTSAGSSLQPAYTYGTPGVEYIVYEGGINQLQLARIENVTGTPLWQPLPPVTVSPYQRSVSLPGAPQAGDSRTIDTSDTRLLNAVYRNGHVWTTHTVSRTVAGIERTEVAWYRIDPGSSTVAAQGRITDTLFGNTVRWYYYPSVAVNGNDVAALGFSGSSAVEYAGGYYTLLHPPYLSAEPVSLLKSGDAPYYKSLSRGDNRWGDFSATVVDPADDVTFWTLQEYAKDPVLDTRTDTFVSQWGTWWGKFHTATVSAPTNLTATLDNTSQVILRWADVSNETGFQIERRRLPGQDYVPIDNVAQNVTTYTDNASKGLLGGFTYSYRVRASDATGGSYSAEAFVTIAAPPPPPSSGGGGGCLSITPASASSADASAVLSLLILFLPAAVSFYGWKRRSRSGNV